jgi:hypothetical protein
MGKIKICLQKKTISIYVNEHNLFLIYIILGIKYK